ncbi:hypothetical protein T190130A13A_30342 [Tenacibaculum sp. 190130A14a]|uniref:Uncharacterized protein n=1 Tax=Tenacibaculum polynesiense TaxID=3137857 RepID=A0ABM9PCB1_9FLAO
MEFNLENTYMRSLPIRGVKSSMGVCEDVFSIPRFLMIC